MTTSPRLDTPAVAHARTNTWGIEIETVAGTRFRHVDMRTFRAAVARAVAAGVQAATGRPATAATGGDTCTVRMEDGRVWTVMHDGSLEDGGAEIVSPIMCGLGEIEIVQAVVREVRAIGAISSSDKKCGIHVHVGGSSLDAAAIARLGRMTAKIEPLLVEALGVSPERERYCRPVSMHFVTALRPGMSREAVQRAWYGHSGARPSRYDQTRYHGLNLNSFFYRGTVEFRYFNGTLHAGEVKAFVQFCLALVGRAATSRSASKKATPTENCGKFDRMRLYLSNTLTLRGEEFETARLHLTKRLAKKGASAPAAPAAEVA